MFQSPSLRGSGRFTWGGPNIGQEGQVSIPFIAGQWSLPGGETPRRRCVEVSIPFIAGQWSLPAPVRRRRMGGRVSIPFIAGQWSLHWGGGPKGLSSPEFQSPSLRGSGRFRVAPPGWPTGAPCFNPLHCGAVVASMAWTCDAPNTARFNPLHCGAVVASRRWRRRQWYNTQVSIPFIAGQWSLRGNAARWFHRAAVFQSPSLRGSGRFMTYEASFRRS